MLHLPHAAEGALARIQQADTRLCLWMNRALRYAAVPHFFRAVSWLGNGIFWYALMLGLLVRHGAEAALPVLHMAFVGAVCTATYSMVKRGTLRERPYQVLSGVAIGAVPLDRFSFPSGHTLHAVAFTMVAALHYPGLAAPLTVFTVLTGASRVVLGLHYPSDVLAGAAIGALIAGASFWI
jgi:undecaprenyl-diphosphatase